MENVDFASAASTSSPRSSARRRDESPSSSDDKETERARFNEDQGRARTHRTHMPEGSFPRRDATQPDCEKSCEKSSSESEGRPVTDSVTTPIGLVVEPRERAVVAGQTA